MESRQRWVRHHRSEQGVVFILKGHTENTKLMKKIPLNSNNSLSYTWMTVVLQLWTAFNSRDEVGVLVCFCWRLCKEVPPADSSRIQSPRAQGCAPAAERSQTPLWNRSWCTGILFSQHYRPQQQQYTCRAAPLSERGAARLLSEELLITLWVIYLLLGSESPAPATLFLPSPMP